MHHLRAGMFFGFAKQEMSGKVSRMQQILPPSLAQPKASPWTTMQPCVPPLCDAEETLETWAQLLVLYRHRKDVEPSWHRTLQKRTRTRLRLCISQVTSLEKAQTQMPTLDEVVSSANRSAPCALGMASCFVAHATQADADTAHQLVL